MLTKKNTLVVFVILLAILGGGIWSMQNQKQVKKAFNTVNVFHKPEQKKEKDTKKSSAQENAEKPFVTTIAPQTVSNPNHVDFSINTVSREEADKKAKNVIKTLGEVAPQNNIEKNKDGMIAEYTQILSQLFPNVSDETRQKLMENHILDRYQSDMLIKQSKEGKISWQAMQAAGWGLALRQDADMQSLLSDEEYLKFMGSSKADNVIGQVPHPYDDPEGKYWKQSEIFQNFAVQKATNGVIATEDQLYEYIAPDTVAEAVKINKTMEYEHYRTSQASSDHEITDDEFRQQWTASSDAAKQQMRDILTPEEGKILGLESWWPKEE